MRSAWAAISLTLLTGVAQGLFISQIVAETMGRTDRWPEQLGHVYVLTSVVTIVLLAAALSVSFLHPGRPRNVAHAMRHWRTSWMFRNVIMILLTLGVVTLYAMLHLSAGNGLSSTTGTIVAGFAGSFLCCLLYLCTAMIYQNVPIVPPHVQAQAQPLGRVWILHRVLQSTTLWTLLNFTSLSFSSGFLLAGTISYSVSGVLTGDYAQTAFLLLLASFAIRVVLLGNDNETMLAVGATQAEGAHVTLPNNITLPANNVSPHRHRRRRNLIGLTAFVAFAFVVPLALLICGEYFNLTRYFVYACIIHLIGLVLERWHFMSR